jgi:parallel beta-helix repeat protein
VRRKVGRPSTTPPDRPLQTAGGTFRDNTVSGNTAWAAVSLYGASGWTISGNTITHPANQPPQPYHPYCATGPNGGHAAGIFLCQDTDANGLLTDNNVWTNNNCSVVNTPSYF